MAKKILITGAAGFIGSHLCELFVKKGFKVRAFDRYNSHNNFGWLDKSKYKKEIDCILGDIRVMTQFLKQWMVVMELYTLLHW